MEKKYFNRLIEMEVEKYLKIFDVLLIYGPK
jgi:hypothetical protein